MVLKKNLSVVREVWLGLGLSLFALFFLWQCNNLNQRAAQYPRIMHNFPNIVDPQATTAPLISKGAINIAVRYHNFVLI